MKHVREFVAQSTRTAAPTPTFNDLDKLLKRVDRIHFVIGPATGWGYSTEERMRKEDRDVNNAIKDVRRTKDATTPEQYSKLAAALWALQNEFDNVDRDINDLERSDNITSTEKDELRSVSFASKDEIGDAAVMAEQLSGERK